MSDLVVVLVVLAIIAVAAGYVVKAKKSGQKCIGCPHSGSCQHGCSCGGEKQK